MEEQSSQAPQWILLIAITILGAVVHATSQLKIARDKNQEFTLIDYLILLPLGAFAGLMFAFIGLAVMPDQPYIVGAFTGIGSSAGMAGLNRLFNILLDFVASRAQANINKLNKEK